MPELRLRQASSQEKMAALPRKSERHSRGRELRESLRQRPLRLNALPDKSSKLSSKGKRRRGKREKPVRRPPGRRLPKRLKLQDSRLRLRLKPLERQLRQLLRLRDRDLLRSPGRRKRRELLHNHSGGRTGL